jgi:hypothetical protein
MVHNKFSPETVLSHGYQRAKHRISCQNISAPQHNRYLKYQAYGKNKLHILKQGGIIHRSNYYL